MPRTPSSLDLAMAFHLCPPLSSTAIASFLVVSPWHISTSQLLRLIHQPSPSAAPNPNYHSLGQGGCLMVGWTLGGVVVFSSQTSNRQWLSVEFSDGVGKVVEPFCSFILFFFFFFFFWKSIKKPPKLPVVCNIALQCSKGNKVVPNYQKVIK
jgi:hypothetical protein